MTITCTLIKDNLNGWNGHAALYKLSEPVKHGYNDETTDHVIISSIDGWAFETYIFPATEEGSPIKMLEMEGSVKNTTDHKIAIERAGWTLV